MEGVRLPNYICPVSYNISLKFAMEGEYSGTVQVTLDFKQESNYFWFHAVNPVEVISVESQGEALNFKAEEHDAFSVQLNQVTSGVATYEIKFRSNVMNEPTGFFKVASSNEDTVFSCQFEPTYARLAIPVLDEPLLKAKFTLQVSIPECEYFVVSNMPASIANLDGWRTFSFEETPVMSTYLLHWTICKHQSLSTVSSKGVSLTLYMPETNKSQYFLDLGRDVLDFYIDYFQIAYPLPKLDLIGLMNLGFRAMENWGAITFMEHILEVFDR